SCEALRCESRASSPRNPLSLVDAATSAQRRETRGVLLGEIGKRFGMHAGGQDLERLDDPRPRSIEVSVPVGEPGARVLRSRQPLPQNVDLLERARKAEAAWLHDDDVR